VALALTCAAFFLASAASQRSVAAAPAPRFAMADKTPLPELPVPPTVRSVNGVAHLQLTAAIDPATKLPAFYFAGRTVPPTIRVWPGDTLVIDYTNHLPVRSLPPMDVTNLHTHGLMDSPKPPGDQVIMTMIAPGQTYRYVYNIPKTQPPGLYWYHPHPHGESNHQVASGMSGLIVIEGIETYAPAVRGLPERDILLRDYYFDPALAPLSRGVRRAVMHEVAREREANPTLELHATIRAVAARAASLPAYAPDCNLKDASDGVTINGIDKATITMAPGTRQFFRIANTSANSVFDMKIPGQKLYLVAYDGVPLAFHDRSLQGEWVDEVYLPPAGRAEVVVQAPAQSGTAFETGCIDTGPAGDNDPGRKMANIVLGVPPATAVMPATAPPAVAEPFGPIDAWKIAAERTVAFSENNPDSEFFINGQLWNPNAPPMFVVKAGTVERWTLYNYASELHVLHIHQVHFRVEDVNGVAAPPDSWRDTFAIPFAKTFNGKLQPGVVHVLMDFRSPTIVGTFVFHCHILEHEDYGMMAKITVIGSPPPSLDSHGFKEGFLNGKPSSRWCKLQTPTLHLCGCDTNGQAVSLRTTRG
jgi:FtsP/CotA-like multicopper oxidase with cupredoxin domain